MACQGVNEARFTNTSVADQHDDLLIFTSLPQQRQVIVRWNCWQQQETVLIPHLSCLTAAQTTKSTLSFTAASESAMVNAKSSKSWPTKQQRNRSVSADSWKRKWKAWLPRTNERIGKLITADSVADCSDRFATKIPIQVFGCFYHQQHRHHHQNLLHGSQSYLIPWVSDQCHQLCAQMFWVALKRKIAPLKVWRPWTCRRSA